MIKDKAKKKSYRAGGVGGFFRSLVCLSWNRQATQRPPPQLICTALTHAERIMESYCQSHLWYSHSNEPETFDSYPSVALASLTFFVLTTPTSMIFWLDIRNMTYSFEVHHLWWLIASSFQLLVFFTMFSFCLEHVRKARHYSPTSFPRARWKSSMSFNIPGRWNFRPMDFDIIWKMLGGDADNSFKTNMIWAFYFSLRLTSTDLSSLDLNCNYLTVKDSSLEKSRFLSPAPFNSFQSMQ